MTATGESNSRTETTRRNRADGCQPFSLLDEVARSVEGPIRRTPGDPDDQSDCFQLSCGVRLRSPRQFGGVLIRRLIRRHEEARCDS